MNDVEILELARKCHEVNKHWCELHGDNSQVSWEDAPQWQRDTCVDGVTFRINNPWAPVSASHDNWLKYKRLDGWVWGPVKDPEKKQHPCMVPYEELDPVQRTKDALFTAIVWTAMIARA